MIKKVIYLDHAAATPMNPHVQDSMKPYLSDKFYNPSANYISARKVKADVEKARGLVAGWMGAKPVNIIFTAGGTEANNLALFGVAQNFPKCHIVSTQIEHESILNPLKHLKNIGVANTLVAPSRDGLVAPDKIANAVTPKTVLVSVMYANNEIGSIQKIKHISSEIIKIRINRQKDGNKLPIYFHIDACQASAFLDLHVANLGVDMMTLNGGKIYGPKQSGILYANSKVKLSAQIYGGGQEHGFRSGTENVAGIIGFAEALNLVQQNKEFEKSRMQKLQSIFVGELKSKLPNAILNGSIKSRLPNNIHLSIPNTDNERIVFELDEVGVQCAVGSACSASNDEPSHVLKAIGMSDQLAQSSIRFTMGQSTTEKDIKYTILALAKIVAT